MNSQGTRNAKSEDTKRETDKRCGHLNNRALGPLEGFKNETHQGEGKGKENRESRKGQFTQAGLQKVCGGGSEHFSSRGSVKCPFLKTNMPLC